MTSVQQTFHRYTIHLIRLYLFLDLVESLFNPSIYIEIWPNLQSLQGLVGGITLTVFFPFFGGFELLAYYYWSGTTRTQQYYICCPSSCRTVKALASRMALSEKGEW